MPIVFVVNRTGPIHTVWSPQGHTPLLQLNSTVITIVSFITYTNSFRCEQDGPIHDVQWSPQGDFFLVAAGFMPAKVTLFTQKCDPFYDLGSGPYNMVRWSPQVITSAD
jgi:uncharacterized protein with WD repeat